MAELEQPGACLVSWRGFCCALHLEEQKEPRNTRGYIGRDLLVCGESRRPFEFQERVQRGYNLGRRTRTGRACGWICFRFFLNSFSFVVSWLCYVALY